MEYLKSDVAQILNKPARTIMFWTDCGTITPDIQPSQGRGKARIYSERNLIEFAMTDVLSKEHGFSLQVIGNIFKRIRKEKFETFYTDPDWINNWEMVFVGDKRKTMPFKLKILHQKASFEDLTRLYRDFFSDEETIEFTTVLLGRVKADAVKSIE